jgi:hypothetical protein
MTTLFVHSLQRLPSLQATVISTAANMTATVSKYETPVGFVKPSQQWELRSCQRHILWGEVIWHPKQLR